MKESDLYRPVKQLLESQGYEVKAEIEECDVLAVRGDEEPVVVELKLSLNFGVLLQAVDRIALTPKVYVGVPVTCGILNSQRKRVIKLLRMLGLGLISIDPGDSQAAYIELDPGEYRPRKSKHRKEQLLGEFERRVGDPNEGGQDRRKGVMTAYRQRALIIAHYLREHGATKASDVSAAVADPKARDVLYDDVYGWFNRADRGIYELSPQGESEIDQWLAP